MNRLLAGTSCLTLLLLAQGCNLEFFAPKKDPFYRTIGEVYPRNKTVLFLEGRDLARAGRFKDAAAAFERLARLDPGNPRVSMLLGVARLEMRDGRGAEKAFRMALAQGGAGPEARIGLANALILQGKVEEPRQIAEELAASGETAALARLRGDIAFVGDDPAAALEHYELSLRLNPAQNELVDRIADLRVLLAGRGN